MKFLYIAIGGGIGSLLRYLLQGAVHKMSGSIFPLGTMVVNLSGSFLIGFLWGLSERFTVAPNFKTFIFIGVLGGFTTFSSFGLESFHLLRDGEIRLALINILGSNILGIVLVFVGFGLAHYLTEFVK